MRKKRRQKGRGSIRFRKDLGKWVVDFTDDTGQRQQRVVSADREEAELELKQTESRSRKAHTSTAVQR